MPDHPFGWISLTPPLLAIVFAIATRRVILSLMLGVLLGSLLIAIWPPDGAGTETIVLEGPLAFVERAAYDFFEVRLWGSLTDDSHLRVFLFTALMGAMIGVVQRAGGMQDIVRRLAPLSGSRRGGQLLTWALGLIVFIDDYANSLLLGNTMRPLCDRLKISREKLAYIVDSTAAPVSGLALVSTWVAGEIANIEVGLEGLEFTNDVEPFGLFLQTIPYRFYVLWALLFVPLNAWMRRDFGPMLKAERAALAAGGGPAESKSAAGKPSASPTAESRIEGYWFDAAAPIVATVAVVVAMLYATGRAGLTSVSPGLKGWGEIFGNGDSNLALVYGSLVGLLLAAGLAWRRGMSAARISVAAGQGARFVGSALAILWLAWALSDLTGKEALATGDYLAMTLQGAIGLWLLPTVVFLLAFFVAFATGTSWGTMSMLMPLVIQTTYALLNEGGAAVSGDETVLVASVGGVLAGAIFGDHCSPISDTTVLSSQASGCNHIAHVWTQMPYALLVGAVSVLCGCLPVGLGAPVWITTPLALVAMIAFLLLFGRNAEQPATSG